MTRTQGLFRPFPFPESQLSTSSKWGRWDLFGLPTPFGPLSAFAVRACQNGANEALAAFVSLKGLNLKLLDSPTSIFLSSQAAPALSRKPSQSCRRLYNFYVSVSDLTWEPAVKPLPCKKPGSITEAETVEVLAT